MSHIGISSDDDPRKLKKHSNHSLFQSLFSDKNKASPVWKMKSPMMHRISVAACFMAFMRPLAVSFVLRHALLAPIPSPLCGNLPVPSSGVVVVQLASSNAGPPPFSEYGSNAYASHPSISAEPRQDLPPPMAHWSTPTEPSPSNNAGPPPFSEWGSVAPSPVVKSVPNAPPEAVGVAADLPTISGPTRDFKGAMGILYTAQSRDVDVIADVLKDLSVKPDLCWTAEPISTAAQPATLDARDAPGRSNLAWLASLHVPGKLVSLTIFNGPLTDVPHLLSRCLLDGDRLLFALDFRPRAYGAYEMVDAHGNYPGPEQLGRKAFEYSGARSDYFSKFATDKLKAQVQDILSALEGPVTNVEPSPAERLTGGPIAVSLAVPATEGNADKIAVLRSKAVEWWLQWTQEDNHSHRPGAPINTQYVYDAKFRQNAYNALLPLYMQYFGAGDGVKLAVADSGPLDEAYVGGAS